MISGVPSPLTGIPASVVIAIGKDGALGDGERGTYSSEGERDSLRAGEAGI